ncbi:hypothetical protein NXG27_07275 [Megasphaera paucivorans]|uniref:hypothetical protein n=1 Tax=Megasphaera paucivorans TaxID=349095 RepID=UPI001C40AECA|nr:hypothetical protein [Megasphaera paucivorans]
MSKKGSEQIARLRRCGTMAAYVEERLIGRTYQETPTVWESALKNQIAKHRYSYCNQTVNQYSIGLLVAHSSSDDIHSYHPQIAARISIAVLGRLLVILPDL